MTEKTRLRPFFSMFLLTCLAWAVGWVADVSLVSVLPALHALLPPFFLVWAAVTLVQSFFTHRLGISPIAWLVWSLPGALAAVLVARVLPSGNALLFAVAGCVSVPQWLLLRKHVKLAWLWVFVYIVGVPMSFALTYLAITLFVVAALASAGYTYVIVVCIVGLLGGAPLGLFTALFFARAKQLPNKP